MNTIIFDLDGTLIDSAPAILHCLDQALIKNAIDPLFPLGPELVGPPLDELIGKISGSSDPELLKNVGKDFKELYDSEGFAFSLAYDGVDHLLKQLHQKGFTLYLATNKRINPTLKIIQHFGWTDLFSDIYAIDVLPQNIFQNKTAMLEHLIHVHQLKQDHVIYVGDRIEDQEAASLNGLFSLTVTWGYGDYGNLQDYTRIVTSPSAAYNSIANG
jgi:phosphoglycolate phosphatase